MSVTRQKNLWSGKPIWFAYPSPAIQSLALTKDINCDVAIVGAGVSGATLAQQLSEDGLSVCLLDCRKPGYGSTSASTALLQYELDTPLTQLARDIGEDKALRAWRRSKLGLENLAAKTQSLAIKCDFERNDALYLEGTSLNAEDLEQEAKARRSIGLFTEYLDRNRVLASFSISKRAALRVRDNISLHPRRFVAGYLKSAQYYGAKIYSPVTIDHVEHHRHFVSLYTSERFEIKARFAVFATGYEIFKGIKLNNKAIYSSWAIATKPQPRKIWAEGLHIWEASKPYLYMRPTPDGRVICGGEDEEFTDEVKRDALIPQKVKELQRKLHKLFPQLDTTAEFSWAGCFGETSTGLPMMGAVPGMPHCFAILAFGGNGITFSRIGAEIISSALTGKEDPDMDLFLIR